MLKAALLLKRSDLLVRIDEAYYRNRMFACKYHKSFSIARN